MIKFFWIGALIFVLFLIVRKSTGTGSSVSYPPPGQGTMDDVRRLILEKQKIAAIKVYREIHGTDLKDSKDAVEKLEREMGRPDA